MQRSSLWAACAVLSISSLPAQQPAVAVFMDFERVPGPAAVTTMEREVERLLKPSGIALDWRWAKENRGDRLFPELAVFRFKGTCKAERVPIPAANFGSVGETQALASTRVSEGRVLPFSEVQCDQVRAALRFLRPGAGLRERQAALGRALGRVVAHELYHILAGTTGHGRRGLAKASHSLEDLVSTHGPAFGEEDARAMAASAEPMR